MAPRLVAEALQPVNVPAATLMCPGPAAPAASVVDAMLHTIAPPEAADAPPGHLRPDQVRPFRRVIAAVRQHGGALLASPVGSGKTHVALAAARALSPGMPVTCLVPAGLEAHWLEVADRVGLRIQAWSHALLSRGRVPDLAEGPVIIDESHHFRHPVIKRYRHAAERLRGHQVVFVTATPVVNRAEDLVHQLRLAVRDDALRPHGLPSLLAAARSGHGLELLGHLVVAAPGPVGPAFDRHEVAIPLDRQTRVLIEGIERLRGSRDAGVAALIRQVFLRALASSPEALAASLRRYRLLLLQARDAAAGGVTLSRGALRRMAGPDVAQLVLWPMLAAESEPLELALGDLDAIPALEREALAPAGDRRRELLAATLADGHPTVVFTTSRETVAALRRLRPSAAWCCGDGAGVGHIRMSRAEALAPFARAGGPRGREPRLLLASDVASEGLNLRGLRRVVHWDLPWTPARLTQRGGRARRLDSTWESVEEIVYLPPPALESRLAMVSRLTAKERTWQRVLVEPPWRWRAALAEAPGGTGIEGIATVTAPRPGVLAAVRFLGRTEVERQVLGGWIGWWDGTTWHEDRHAVTAALASVGRAQPATPVAPPAHAMAALGRMIAARLAAMRAGMLDGSPAGPAAAAVRRRLTALVRTARRDRDAPMLQSLERGLRRIERPGTAGDQLELARLVSATDAALRAWAGGLPAVPAAPLLPVAEVTGIVVCRPGLPRLPSPDATLPDRVARPRRHHPRLDPADR